MDHRWQQGWVAKSRSDLARREIDNMWPGGTSQTCVAANLAAVLSTRLRSLFLF
jgi:hypothetical protein